MGGCKGLVTHFIVEPFVPHEEEYYLSITSQRLGCEISFSECGGVDIEENWDKVAFTSHASSSGEAQIGFTDPINLFLYQRVVDDSACIEVTAL